MILSSLVIAGHNWWQLDSILSILVLLVIIAFGIWWLLDGEEKSQLTLSSGLHKMRHYCATPSVCICQEHLLGRNDLGGAKLSKIHTML